MSALIQNSTNHHGRYQPLCCQYGLLPLKAFAIKVNLTEATQLSLYSKQQLLQLQQLHWQQPPEK
jgi:hypothetical protein